MQLSHRNHSSEFKARVILEALQGEAALAELAQRQGMQASQITAEDFTRRLEAKGVQGRMGGKGRWADHVFVERLPWRPVLGGRAVSSRTATSSPTRL